MREEDMLRTGCEDRRLTLTLATDRLADGPLSALRTARQA